MKKLKDFTIQFVGLSTGIHLFDYRIDKTFFEEFEYNELNDIDVLASVKLVKKETLLEFNFKVSGNVNVNCDLTNEPYAESINGDFDLVVKFGEDYNDENEEILIIPHGEYEINVAQYIYELIVLSIPSKRIHPGVKDGTLQSDILERLEELSPKEKDNTTNKETIDPRWDTLKKLLTDK
ncbi:MAG: DUF177 domain-containing protein [Bacteroidia bacterium]|nr:DUF177 domain-containing protein [Bacteroidia bacterium]NND11954.1 DUF177 domain-containing protein [Flavobacteriaceae bacterium]MBT8310808.1 DUF177 domain-containing protein [Bacteroidia bacterium]NNK27082.1 DUF177 domain-containing protein [Flavobacteriaceae bacterium]NNL60228.1 DUF177 domain-containing protein [Flavobacteriaceae bacterium]